MRIAFGLLLLLVGLAAQAQVYKWVDENGVVHYTDQPPAKNAEPARLPPLQTFKGGALPKLDNSAGAEDTVRPVPTKVRIASPTPDETFRSDSEGQVTVSVVVSPELKPEQALVYYVDGVAQGEAIRDYRFTVQNLERGSHSLSVAVVEGKKEVSRSAPVTIHMKQATIRR